MHLSVGACINTPWNVYQAACYFNGDRNERNCSQKNGISKTFNTKRKKKRNELYSNKMY